MCIRTLCATLQDSQHDGTGLSSRFACHGPTLRVQANTDSAWRNCTNLPKVLHLSCFKSWELIKYIFKNLSVSLASMNMINMIEHAKSCEKRWNDVKCIASSQFRWVPSLSANTLRRRAWRRASCWAMCSAGSTDSTDSTCSNHVQTVFKQSQHIPKISERNIPNYPKFQTVFNHALTQLQTSPNPMIPKLWQLWCRKQRRGGSGLSALAPAPCAPSFHVVNVSLQRGRDLAAWGRVYQHLSVPLSTYQFSVTMICDDMCLCICIYIYYIIINVITRLCNLVYIRSQHDPPGHLCISIHWGIKTCHQSEMIRESNMPESYVGIIITFHYVPLRSILTSWIWASNAFAHILWPGFGSQCTTVHDSVQFPLVKWKPWLHVHRGLELVNSCKLVALQN